MIRMKTEINCKKFQNLKTKFEPRRNAYSFEHLESPKIDSIETSLCDIVMAYKTRRQVRSDYSTSSPTDACACEYGRLQGIRAQSQSAGVKSLGCSAPNVSILSSVTTCQGGVPPQAPPSYAHWGR